MNHRPATYLLSALILMTALFSASQKKNSRETRTNNTNQNKKYNENDVAPSFVVDWKERKASKKRSHKKVTQPFKRYLDNGSDATSSGPSQKASKEDLLIIVEIDKVSRLGRLSDLLGESGRIVESLGNKIKILVAPELVPLLAQERYVNSLKPPLRPRLLAIEGEEISLTGISNLHASTSLRGDGIDIAIIDVGFSNIGIAVAAGEINSNAVQINYSSSGFEELSIHGTGCAEIIQEIVPGARLHLINIYDVIDLDQAMNYCRVNNIDLISMSLGWSLGGPGDGTGVISDVVNEGAGYGQLWFVAAGNEARQHYYKNYTDIDGDDNHDFSGTSDDDEVNEIGWAGIGSEISVYMSWNDPWSGSGNDYDLYLMRWHSGSSTWIEADFSEWEQNGNDEPSELIIFDVVTPGFYGVQVRKYSGNNRTIRLWTYFDEFEDIVSNYSISQPADAAGVVAVGAIDAVDWSAGQIEDFSSLGPTIDGRIKPDISGMDGMANLMYGNFFGTSAATPMVTGVAALLKNAYTNLSMLELKALIFSNADDISIPGRDNFTGYGRVSATVDILGAPGIPAGQATYIPSNSIHFSWGPGTIRNVEYSYRIQISTNSNISGILLEAATALTNYYNFNGVASGVSYYARSCATNFEGASSWSSWGPYTLYDINPPPAPIMSNHHSWSDLTVDFNWIVVPDAESQVVSFIMVTASNTNTGVWWTNTFTTNQGVFSNGVEGYAWYSKVSSINSVGLASLFSSWSSAVWIETAPPTVPSVLPFSSRVFVGNITVNWTVSTDISNAVTGYELMITGSDGSVVSVGGLTNTSYFFSSTSIGMEYYFQVRSVDAAGNISAWSAPSDGVVSYINSPGTWAWLINNLSDGEEDSLYVYLRESGEYEIYLLDLEGDIKKFWISSVSTAGDLRSLNISGMELKSGQYYLLVKTSTREELLKYYVKK